MEEIDFELDDSPIEETMEVIKTPEPVQEKTTGNKQAIIDYGKEYVNCLRNERIVVRHIPKDSGLFSGKNHVLSGGMAETSQKIFSVPKLQSGIFVNVLTDAEKDYLEMIMGLETNALSVYKKTNNFWDETNPNGIGKVILFKQDNYFDLSNPEDYIRYKILLANKDFICPSPQELQRNPKRTYQFVIIEKGADSRMDEAAIGNKQKCYMEFGKISDDRHLMSMVIEILDNRNVAASSEMSWLKVRIDEWITKNPTKTLSVLTDPMLKTKVLLKKAINAGMVVERGKYLYMNETIGSVNKGEPLCESGEEPLFDIAARFLNHPKRQETKFRLEESLNNI